MNTENTTETKVDAVSETAIKDTTPVITDLDLESLIKLGTLSKEYKLTSKVTVKVKTLTQADREACTKLIKIPTSDLVDKTDALVESAKTYYSLFEAFKVPVLTYAIIQINELDFSTFESKPRLQTLLSQLPPAMIDSLYTVYTDYENEFSALMAEDALKKK